MWIDNSSKEVKKKVVLSFKIFFGPNISQKMPEKIFCAFELDWEIIFKRIMRFDQVFEIKEDSQKRWDIMQKSI